MNWNFPLYRIGGIEVRIHWTLPLFFAFILIKGGLEGMLGISALGLGILFAQVLAHEYGHAITARRLGEEAETIMLSMMGGAAYCAPGANTKRAMLITVMGPVVNLVIAVGSGVALASLGLWDWSLLNPFEGWAQFPHLGHTALLFTFKIGLMLLLFNLCVPAYPLDGGRLVLLWASDRYGRADGARISTNISIPIAFAIILWGLLANEVMLVIIGAWVLVEAFQIRKLIEYGAIDQHPAFPSDPGYGSGYNPTYGTYDARKPRRMGFFARWRARRREKSERQREEREAMLRVQVDQVLEKVSREGIGSLSTIERQILDEASRKYRGE